MKDKKPDENKDKKVSAWEEEEAIIGSYLARNACADCGSNFWSSSILDDNGRYAKCDLCHVFDEKQNKLVPKYLN